MKMFSQQESARDKLIRWKVGALFMEAGTGKTRVAVELVNSTDCDLVVWVAPLRTIKTQEGVPSVIDEINKWGGFRAESVFYGVESIQASKRIYLELLSLVEQHEKVFIVVDESLKIKNADAKRTKRLLELSKKVD